MLKTLKDLYLYGCFHIAFSTTLLAVFSFDIFNIDIPWIFLSLVFFGTLVIYNGHRLISKSKLSTHKFIGRFDIIHQLERPILIILIIASLAAAYCFFLVEFELKLSIFPLGLISMLYILPIFGKGRRLRDLPFIKIFLIAIVYCILCHYLPIDYYGSLPESINLMWSSGSIFLFIFAITLPFDIRDLEIDKAQNLLSIINKLGFRFGIYLGVSLLVLSGMISSYLWTQNFYSSTVCLSLILSYIIAAILILNSNPEREDYYYTLWLDGTMALPYLFYLFLRLV